jgi:micrococcal nuclease
MPKGLIFRLFVLLVTAVIASFYFRGEAGVPAAPRGANAPAPATGTGEAGSARDSGGAAAPPVAAAPRGERLGPCDVAHVIDGDTIDVRCGAREERVRMLQIDTPEREQPLYAEASAALAARVDGRRVELELGTEQRDDHGRLLAYVFANGENVNLAMIRDGFSPYFDRYGAGAYPREFAEAERAARTAGLGIWAPP